MKTIKIQNSLFFVNNLSGISFERGFYATETPYFLTENKVLELPQIIETAVCQFLRGDVEISKSNFLEISISTKKGCETIEGKYMTKMSNENIESFEIVIK